MTLQTAATALDRMVVVEERRRERVSLQLQLPSNPHVNMRSLLLPWPWLPHVDADSKRGVRDGQPLTQATGPLIRIRTGSRRWDRRLGLSACHARILVICLAPLLP